MASATLTLNMSNHSKKTFIVQPVIRLPACVSSCVYRTPDTTRWHLCQLTVWFASSWQQFQHSVQRLLPGIMPSGAAATDYIPALGFLIPSPAAIWRGMWKRETLVCCTSEGLSYPPSPFMTLRLQWSDFLTEASCTQRCFGFLIVSNHQRWRPKPKEEQWINNSLWQLSRFIQCRSVEGFAMTCG